MALRVALAVAVGLAVAPAAPAAEVSFGEVEVRTLPSMPAAGSHGYREHRIRVSNRSAARSHSVTLLLPRDPVAAQGIQLRQVRRTVEVGPGAAAEVSLPVPQLNVMGTGLGVVIDGGLQRQAVGLDLPSSGSWSYAYSSSPVVLASSRVNPEDFPPHQDHEYMVVRADFSMASWSESWLAYTGYDAVVLTAGELVEAPPGVLQALADFVLAGGTLLILGSSLDDPLPGAALPLGGLTAPVTFASSTMAARPAGFGLVLESAAPNIAALEEAFFGRLRAAMVASHGPWDQLHGLANAHHGFPVVENLRVPVRGLFLLMLGFALVAGPVNLWFLSRRNRRVWILWTLPLVALLTSGLVLAYTLLAEGTDRHQRSEVLTLLDESGRKAVTLARTALYAPLTPSDGLRFSPSTDVAAFRDDYRDSGGGRIIDWTRDQHLAAGWLRARVPAQLALRKVELRRERLVVRAADTGQDGRDELLVVNGLGAPIDALWVAASRGRIFHGEDLAAGSEARLALEEGSFPGPAAPLREVFSGSWTDFHKPFERPRGEVLVEGSYLAFLDGAPFLEEALPGVEQRRERSVVFGMLEEVP